MEHAYPILRHPSLYCDLIQVNAFWLLACCLDLMDMMSIASGASWRKEEDKECWNSGNASGMPLCVLCISRAQLLRDGVNLMRTLGCRSCAGAPPPRTVVSSHATSPRGLASRPSLPTAQSCPWHHPLNPGASRQSSQPRIKECCPNRVAMSAPSASLLWMMPCNPSHGRLLFKLVNPTRAAVLIPLPRPHYKNPPRAQLEGRSSSSSPHKPPGQRN